MVFQEPPIIVESGPGYFPGQNVMETHSNGAEKRINPEPQRKVG
jgi:hypothetical protein